MAVASRRRRRVSINYFLSMSRCEYFLFQPLLAPFVYTYKLVRKYISAYGVRLNRKLESAPPPHHLVTRHIRICVVVVVVVLQPHLTLFAHIYLFICVYNTRRRVCSSTHIRKYKYIANKFVAAPMQTNDIALVCGGAWRRARPFLWLGAYARIKRLNGRVWASRRCTEK